MKKTFTVLMMVLLAAMLIVSCDNRATEPGYTGKTYEVGKEGPSGGIVFYDVDADNNSGNADGLKSSVCGWRYLEAAPTNIGGWSIGGLKDGAKTSGGIGAGDEDTVALEGYLANATSTQAFKKVKEYKVTKDGVDYTGWYIPTEAELKAAIPYLGEITKNLWTCTIKSSTELTRYAFSNKTFSASNPSMVSCTIHCVRKF